MTMNFHALELPQGGTADLPDDIELQFPRGSKVATERLHLLAYIPWQERYLERVPMEYREFFQAVLPFLSARTTNVHTATCLPFLGELIRATGWRVDGRVAHIALILHDSGWSEMTEEEIADSLDYRGLADKGEAEIAKGPKAKHDLLGERIAQKLLTDYAFEPALAEAQKEFVAIIVRNHTEPWKYAPDGRVPHELILVSEADRLWSYTHENFWQDTVRKGVPPREYAQTLRRAIPGYFMTEEGRTKAKELMEERLEEVWVLSEKSLIFY